MTDGRQNILQQHRACAYLFLQSTPSTNHTSRRRLTAVKYRVTKRLLRLLLAISVSLWISGAGCLWGCSQMSPTSSVQAQVNSDPAVTGHSCHSKAHDCCAKKSRHNNASTYVPPFNTGVMDALSEGMMNECPMAINANAVVSKANATSFDSDHIVTFDSVSLSANNFHRIALRSPVQFLNRGPTYLRCCIFLI